MSAKRKAESDSRSANRPRVMRSGGSRAESERDSGFSDASTMDTTDSEDSPRPFVQQGPPTPGSGGQASQLAVVGGSYSSLSPMIIMNNVLLKQPGDNPPALKPWGFSPAVEVVQPVVQQSQVVFLQPVVSRQASSKDASRHRRPKKYLPILKSYPKIAPHPGDSGSSSSSSSSSSGRGSASSSSSSSTSSSSSSVSGSERGSSSASSHRDHYQRPKQQRSLSSSSSGVGSGSGSSSCSSSSSGSATPILPASPISKPPAPQSRVPDSGSDSSESPQPAASQSELAPSPSVLHTGGSKSHHSPPAADPAPPEPLGELSLSEDGADGDTRRKRFCNTYNILNKSGLLDITLRTKELLRQNRRTQNDLDRLKEHTDLFLRALRSGDTSICVQLHASLQEEEERERERASHAGHAGHAGHASLKAD